MKKLVSPDTAINDEFILDIYSYQYNYNRNFQQFCDLVQLQPTRVNEVKKCAFLPVAFFKSHEIKSGEWEPQKIFESSTTTGNIPSRHLIRDNNYYLKNAELCFEDSFGPVSDFCFLGLLPSYLERSNSSLIEMIRHFIGISDYKESSFYLNDLAKLKEQLLYNIRLKIPTILWGVSYALLDLADVYPLDLKDIIIMETGGMKGRRVEISKSELHKILCKAFNVGRIYSEYGMTELLSQAYSLGEGLYDLPDTMRIIIRSIDDPMHTLANGKRGRICLVDMANIDSCSFIGTDDLGILHPNNQLEIIGRLDGSEQRGCNLLVD